MRFSKKQQSGSTLLFFHFLKENPVVTLPAERTRTINGLIIALEDLYKDKENCFRLQILRSYTQSFLLDIYDKTHCIFKAEPPGRNQPGKICSNDLSS